MSRTVYVPGVFDLLHAGHFNLLWKCRLLAGEGGRLVVGVCPDDICLRTKRKPFWDEATRARMVGLLEIVDEVIVYRDLDQSAVLESLRPALFVHGPDYGNLEDQMKTISTAERIGSEVVVASRTEGVSTTDLLEGINGA